jgi:hypothetical protein
MATESERENEANRHRRLAEERAALDKCLAEGRLATAVDYAWANGWIPEVRAVVDACPEKIAAIERHRAGEISAAELCAIMDAPMAGRGEG